MRASYWSSSASGPKNFVAVFADGATEPFDLVTRENPLSREKLSRANEIQAKNPIGVISLVPACNKWCGHFDSNRLTNGYMPEKADDPMELVPILIERYNQTRAEWSRLESDPLAMLEFCLKVHDWTYSYSDDHRVWSAGSANFKKIRSLIDQVDREKAKELWDKYALEGYFFPES